MPVMSGQSVELPDRLTPIGIGLVLPEGADGCHDGRGEKAGYEDPDAGRQRPPWDRGGHDDVAQIGEVGRIAGHGEAAPRTECATLRPSSSRSCSIGSRSALIGSTGIERLRENPSIRLRRSAKACANPRRSPRRIRVDLDLTLRLGDDCRADLRKACLERIVDEDAQHVVMGREGGHALHGLAVGPGSIGDQAEKPIVLQEGGGMLKGGVEGRGPRRSENVARQFPVRAHHRIDHRQRSRVPGLRLDRFHILVREHHGADPVSERGHPPGGGCRDLGGDHGFRGAAAAEEHRQALVHEQHHGPVPLLRIDADERIAQARRRVPVDGAGIIAGIVGAQLLEIQAAAAKARSMASGEDAVHGLARQEAEAPCLVAQADEFIRRHHDPALTLGGEARGFD